ncbi:4Fe-4S binding protein [Zhaonella formicivorans]|uniref:4Fe-4S binding protein n=1 Tax=Zhaonella formicivorans TaxID=2528593 RepID=UPI0010E2FFFF|nr:4Fe-4S binding protein [Zhaonella formicivorans]
MKESNTGGVFIVEKCRGKGSCPNALLDTGELAEKVKQLLNKFDCLLGANEMLLYHRISRIAIAGCPNGCSQPQIKDIGISGKVRLNFQPELCIKCGACIQICKEGALLEAGGAPVLLESKCLGCGECTRACQAGAWQVGATGLKVVAGGKLGRHPKLAEEIYPFASFEELLGLLDNLHGYMKSKLNGKTERLSVLLAEHGMADFKKICCQSK